MLKDSDSGFKKRRWGSWWGRFWCFLSNRNKRIGHASETTDTPMTEHLSPLTPITSPFVAPPASPASFFLSEASSAAQSPTSLLSHNSASSHMYSPGGPGSIFAIGPYAHEAHQLVSPPFLSSFTTEPSSSPYTPPPESVHLTNTPSSPEVPFALLLEHNEARQRHSFSQYEFQSYQLQPGSPINNLVSPSSGISGSGTSSPFRRNELTGVHPIFLEFGSVDLPKLLDVDKVAHWESESPQGSWATTPDAAGLRSCDSTCLLDRQNSDVAPFSDTDDKLQNNENMDGRRISFEITEDEVVRCMEKKPATVPKSSSDSAENVEHIEEEEPSEMANGSHSPESGSPCNSWSFPTIHQS